MGLNLNKIVPWGRNLKEYQFMFDLSQEPRSIISVGDGPACFNAEMRKLGTQVTSVDPLYQLQHSEIQSAVLSAKEQVLAAINPDDFNWNNESTPQIRDPEHLAEIRLQSMELFLEDFKQGKEEGRYLGQSAETLPFAEQSFDLAISSHFLLLYSSQFSYKQHYSTIVEMLRVAKEVQIFPILDLMGAPSIHLQPLQQELEKQGYVFSLEEAPYHFQKGAFQRLRIRR